jgi:hypothetical protein
MRPAAMRAVSFCSAIPTLLRQQPGCRHLRWAEDLSARLVGKIGSRRACYPQAYPQRCLALIELDAAAFPDACAPKRRCGADKSLTPFSLPGRK